MEIHTIVLLGVIVYLTVLNISDRVSAAKKERDLLNRLMSKDFTQYVVGTHDLKQKTVAPSASEVAEALKEDQDGYAYNGVPVV